MVTTTRPLRSDWLIVGGLLALSWLTLFVAHDLAVGDLPSTLPRWSSHLLTAAVVIPLAWRRQRPLEVLGVVTALGLASIALRVPDGLSPSVAIFIALYTAGAYSDHPARDLLRGGSFAATVALAVWEVFRQQDFVGFDAALFSLHLLAVQVAFFLAGWVLGDSVRRRRADQIELQRRADLLAAEQAERERRAVLDERVRIARELHDVVAHHVSVMGVQASAARRVMRADADRAEEALTGVESSARAAVGELHRLLGFLRAAQDDPDRSTPDPRGAPQPDLTELERLVAGCGLPTRIQRIGRARPLPARVELSAYRLVQEALTNTLKHAGRVPIRIVLTYGLEQLHVEVVNEPGRRGVPRNAGAGRGLLGMRERVHMLGGRFEHGSTREGGYRVAAGLPIHRDDIEPAVAARP